MNDLMSRVFPSAQAFMVLLLPALAGCDSISGAVWRVANQGTNLGYKRCLERNADVGLDENIIKEICLRKHLQAVAPHYEANGSYRCNSGACTFEGWIENKSTDIVITEFLVSITHEDNNDEYDNVLTETAPVENLWVEPGRLGSFTVYDLKFNPSEDRLSVGDKPTYWWSLNA